jgi:hypothetical protein
VIDLERGHGQSIAFEHREAIAASLNRKRLSGEIGA